MSLLTAGSIATALGIAWKYWRIPYSFYKWKTATYRDPEVGQSWAFARLSPLNAKGKWHTFTILEIDDSRIIYESNWIPDSPDTAWEAVDQWKTRMTSLRGWIISDKSSLEDQFFGPASED